MDTAEDYLKRIASLNINRSGERRAPHKPLLVLVAIGKLLQGQHELTFDEVKSALVPLLDAYAPPVKTGRHQPELPYWHLRSDNVWEISNENLLTFQKAGFPRKKTLNSSSGHLPEPFRKLLLADKSYLNKVVQILLHRYFAPSLHDEILKMVRISSVYEEQVKEDFTSYHRRRYRDPRFRDQVLHAYGNRCAISGFSATFGESFFGCEAAHVKWHAYDGPDQVDNGLALEPTLHKLLDVGAISFTDDRRALVSASFTGSTEALTRIRALHGQSVRDPIVDYPPLSSTYIKWHRDPNQGGVFREPPLPL